MVIKIGQAGKPLYSPLKELKSSKKARRIWSVEEDSALVQFVALHKDQQPSDVEWPAMKQEHAYWSDASKYLKETAGTEHLREGIFCKSINFVLCCITGGHSYATNDFSYDLTQIFIIGFGTP